MPTYEYLCQKCNHRSEVWQRMTDEPLTICAECGGHVRRVYYPAGIVFKGSGFYKTDHRSGSSASSNGHNGHDHATKSESESKGAVGKTSGESKPAESNLSSGASEVSTTAGTK
jgi:putative FmdB family regulatory protein